jgi:hypothetical protein
VATPATEQTRAIAIVLHRTRILKATQTKSGAMISGSVSRKPAATPTAAAAIRNHFAELRSSARQRKRATAIAPTARHRRTGFVNEDTQNTGLKRRSSDATTPEPRPRADSENRHKSASAAALRSSALARKSVSTSAMIQESALSNATKRG